MMFNVKRIGGGRKTLRAAHPIRKLARSSRFRPIDFGSLALILGTLGGTLVAYAPIFSNESLFRAFFPSITNWILFFVALLLASRVKRAPARFVCIFWSVWFLVGNLNILGAFFTQRLMGFIQVHQANDLFLLGVIAFISGCLVMQLFSKAESRSNAISGFSLAPLSTITRVILCAFPFLFIISVYLTLGQLPILSGRAFVEEMYLYNYGPLYKYKSILLLSMIAFSLTLKEPIYRLQNWVTLILIIVFIFISSIDGKRDVSIPFALAAIIFLSLRTGRTVTNPSAIFTLAIFVIISWLIVMIRGDGNSIAAFEPYRLLEIFGDEYNAFVYSYNYYSRDWIQSLGYDWIRSTLAAIVNGVVLSAFGIDKQSWVFLDSARTWQKAFEEQFGIRTGIISELWYAFGYLLFPIMFCFGGVVHHLAGMLERSRTELGFMTLLGMFAVLSTAIMNQSTVTFGEIVQLGYAWIIFAALDLINLRQIVVREGRLGR